MAGAALTVTIKIQAWSIHIGRLDRMEPLKLSETSAMQPTYTQFHYPETLSTTVSSRREA
jgi:hypothetical protein